MRERKSLVHCVQNDLKKIAKRSDFKYEALTELDKNRSNKEVAIQFNVSGSTLVAWKKRKKSIKLLKIHH